MNDAQNNADRIVAIKIVAIYTLFSVIWISVSDILLHNLIPDPVILTQINIFKDVLFIVLTIALLNYLIKRYFQLSLQAEEAKRQIEIHASALDDSRAAEQDALATVAIVSDALYVSEQRFRTLLENIQLVSVIIDRNGLISFCNGFLSEISGWPREYIISRNWFELFMPQESCETAISELVRGSQISGISMQLEESILTSAGTRRQIAWNITRLHDAEGLMVGTAMIGVDVTEHRKIEEQLRQSHKMEAIGTLAGGVAHDFNNILTVIMGCTDLLRNCPDDNPQLAFRYVDQIAEAANRASGLTRSLLAFSRKENIEVTAVDLNSRVGQLAEFLGRIIGEDIAVQFSLCSTSLGVMADGGQLDQVIMNMVSNARDAMPFGGTLKISTYIAERHMALADGCHETVATASAVLEIADTGVGMDSATLERIFDPFYTTKQPGKGTGLGLSMAYGIVKSHKGTIEVESEQAVGTVFRMILPCIEPFPERIMERTLEKIPSGRETIMLVEDDPVVLHIVKTVLEKAGYRILAAQNGEEGVALFQNTVEPIHLILSDVIMPKKNGIEMCQEINFIYPGIPTIFMSGYAADFMERMQIAGDIVHFITKPLSMERLHIKIHEVLASSSSAYTTEYPQNQLAMAQFES